MATAARRADTVLAMSASKQPKERLQHVVVVGAGMVGLSTAKFLLDRGVEVTVLDRASVASGASWGNAGWITPAMAIPLAEPGVLKHGLTALRDPAAPLHIPLSFDPELWVFLTKFAATCTPAKWRRTMASLTQINREALGAFDALEQDMPAHVRSSPQPFHAAFTDAKARHALLAEFDQVTAAGYPVQATEVEASSLQKLAPGVSADVEAVVRIDGQRTINPGAYVTALGALVKDRGAQVVEGAQVSRLRHGPGGIAVDVVGRQPITADAVVIATGAWLPELAKAYGVRTRLRAGRGYSFSVDQDSASPGAPIGSPIYFPQQRVVCAPLNSADPGRPKVRLGGTMEFRKPDEAFDPARVEAIVRSAQSLVPGLDLEARHDEWVGSRPVTVDGLPLVGPTSAPRVWAHGGHGMWGMCQGPRTSQLLVQQMVDGIVDPALEALAPTR